MDAFKRANEDGKPLRHGSTLKNREGNRYGVRFRRCLCAAPYLESILGMKNASSVTHGLSHPSPVTTFLVPLPTSSVACWGVYVFHNLSYQGYTVSGSSMVVYDLPFAADVRSQELLSMRNAAHDSRESASMEPFSASNILAWP